ncbi:MAG: carbohydrate ABC transporter permease [Eubacteriales bacterium]|nr:carbohydrate ABC transporter permease [Eubacteriales bacterium]
MAGKARINKILRYVIVLVGAWIMLYPILWMISSSLKPLNLIFKDLSLIPSQLTLDNYIKGWKGSGGTSFGRYYINSFVLVFFAMAGNALSCSLAAFAFARLRFKGKNILFGLMMVTLMIPLHVLVIPQYIMFTKLHWMNTILPIVVPKFFATDAFFIFLMVQFIRGIPRDLDEAATIDGCSVYMLFVKIIYPLMVPALVTTLIFTFMWTWNDFFTQMLYTSNADHFTVTLALRMFMDAEESATGSFFAMSSLSLIPIFLMFLFFQKYLVEGIATTGIK